MKIYRDKEEIYSVRKVAFNSIESFEELVFWYLQNEPHTLMNAGLLSKFLARNNIMDMNVIELGIDFMKEFILNKANNLRFTVFDIDQHFVSLAENLNNKLGFSNLYKCGNLLDVSFNKSCFENNQFELAALIQMDYQFSDSQLRNIFSIFHQHKIENLLVFSPSIYNMDKNVCSLRSILIDFVRSLKYRGGGGVVYYKRSQKHFNTLLDKQYFLNDSDHFNYPSGVMNILLYKIKSK